MAYGAFGECTDGRRAYALKIQTFFEKHGLKSRFYYEHIFMHDIQHALQSNQLVVLSTEIHGLGHLILVKGYNGTKTIYANGK